MLGTHTYESTWNFDIIAARMLDPYTVLTFIDKSACDGGRGVQATTQQVEYPMSVWPP